MPLGLGAQMGKGGIVKSIPSHVTDNLKMLHRYNTGSVVPVSDGAALLNGTNAYINCGNPSALQVGAADMSYAAWIKTTSNGEYIIAKRDDSNGAHSLYIHTDGTLIYYNGTHSNSTSSGTVNDGKWHHVACVYDHSELDVFYYIDGVLSSSDSSVSTANFDESASELYIGFRESGDSNHYLDGYICNVGMWSKKLELADIKSIMWKQYEALSSSEKTGLIGWWKCDSEVGSDGNAGDGYILNEDAGAGSTVGLGTLV